MSRSVPLLLILASCGRTPTCEPVLLKAVVDAESPIAFVGDPPKNLLMISIDTLRKDHVGAHGDLGLTPFLDQWSNEGVVFDDHRQCSNWTMAAATCTMHGRYATEIGQIPRLTDNNEPIPEGSPTLASTLEEAGYFTALFSGNAYMSPEWGTATGYRTWSLQPTGLAIGQLGADTLQAAVNAGNADDGWFLHLHYMEPHVPYTPAEEHEVGLAELEPWPWDLRTQEGMKKLKRKWLGLDEQERDLALRYVTRLYQAEVRMVDARIAWTVDKLEQAGLMDDTLVVVWTDHGEQFYEHGYLTHAYELQREENDGVLFVWADNIVPGRFDGPTHAIDLTPTLLELLGVPVPEEMTGVPVGGAPEGRIRMADTAARAGVVQSASLDGVKLHYAWSGVTRAYDRKKDPFEMNDLFDPGDERLEPLWCSICAFRPKLDEGLQRTPKDPPGLRCPDQ